MLAFQMCLAFMAPSAEKLAVLDLDPKGVDKVLAANVNTLVAAAFRKTKRFEVITREDIDKLLKQEEAKQLAGESSNLAPIAQMGEMLGYAKMLHGSLGKIGTQYVLSLSLMDTKDASVVASETITAKEDALVAAVDHAVRGIMEQLAKKAH